MVARDLSKGFQILDFTDSSGDVLAESTLATLLPDLLRLFGIEGLDERIRTPKVFSACVGLANAVRQGWPIEPYEEFLRIELRPI